MIKKVLSLFTPGRDPMTITLDELERLVREAVDPRDVFGDDVPGNLERFLAVCRPDRNPGDERRASAVADALKRFAQFTPEDLQAIARAEAAFRAAGRAVDPPTAPAPSHSMEPAVLVGSPKRAYRLVRRLAVGDLTDVHLARGEADGTNYVLKAARVPDAAEALETERRVLERIVRAAAETHYGRFFPALVESFAVFDGAPKRVNVFRQVPNLYTLEQIHARHPALDGRHLGWIFKRLLTAVGFAHGQGWLHGAVAPPHVLLDVEGHGLVLVGWGHSVEKGDRITSGPARYADWYPPEVRRKDPARPATDVYMAARCMLYLAGGDPVSQSMPEAVPREMQAFFRYCLLEGPKLRPGDAWSALDDFDTILGRVYGAPRYHRLAM
ncbi:MAG: hypothetical protein U0835_25675 [Isosphaeraceae bacterium]